MASMHVDIPENLFEDLLSADFEGIATEVIEEIGPDAETSVKDSARHVIKDKSRTELVESFKATKVYQRPDGVVAYVRATGSPRRSSRRKRGDRRSGTRRVSNNDIAFWLEYGNSHQAAKPFINKAAQDIQRIVDKRCQEILNERTGAK